MADDQRPGSFARSIDPDGGIKGPSLSPAFERASAETPAPSSASNSERTAPPQAVPIHSAQVANTNLSPREPAPPAAYDRAKAAQHVEGMRTDDRAVKDAALKAKAELFARQDAARKATRAPSLSPAFGKSRDRERGD
jgi:hypothetical protein